MPTPEEVVRYLASLTPREAAEHFYRAFLLREMGGGAEPEYHEHLFLGRAYRFDPEVTWEVEVIAPHDPLRWAEGPPSSSDDLCQSGACDQCKSHLVSWSKEAVCPVCGFENAELT